MKFSLLFVLLLSSEAFAKWSVSTFNIRNFDNDPSAGQTDLLELATIIESVKSEVMAFNEIVNHTAFNDMVKRNLADYKSVISSCGGFGKQHLALAFDTKSFEFVSQTEDLTFTGSSNGKCGSLRPVFLVNLKHLASKQIFTFGLIHLKAGSNERALAQRWQQYLLLNTLVKKYTSQNLILLGDFNTTGYNIKDQDYVKFEDLLSRGNLRTMTESIGCTNYWTGTLGGKEHQPSILDHIVIQDKLLPSVKDVKVGSHCAKFACRPETPEVLGKSYNTVSDHCPVQVNFE